MPQLSYSVSDLQQNVDIAMVGDLIHAKDIHNLATQAVINGHTLQLLHLDQDLCLGVPVTEKYNKHRLPSSNMDLSLGMAAAHDASFMCQPG